MATVELNSVEGENFHADVTLDAELTAHTANVSNPHTVTKAQLGLGTVIGFSQKAVTNANYTILDNDEFTDIDFSAGVVDRTCTLPTLAANLGRVIFISKVDAGAGRVTINCEGVEEFLDGIISIALMTQGETLAIRGSSNGWKIF